MQVTQLYGEEMSGDKGHREHRHHKNASGGNDEEKPKTLHQTRDKHVPQLVFVGNLDCAKLETYEKTKKEQGNKEW